MHIINLRLAEIVFQHFFAIVGCKRSFLELQTVPVAQVLNNKHCEILVSCSDKEWNCMQAHGTAYKLM